MYIIYFSVPKAPLDCTKMIRPAAVLLSGVIQLCALATCLAFPPAHHLSSASKKYRQSKVQLQNNNQSSPRANEDFSRRLQTAIGDLKQNGVFDEQEIQSVLYLSRLQSVNLSITYVKNSTIAGLGLFAKTDIQRGEILTCYPGDILLVHDDMGEKVIWGAHVQDHLPDVCIERNIRPEYSLQTSHDRWSIVALPQLGYDNTSYLGHFANDGASAPTCPAELASYVLESQELNNAMHRSWSSCHMVTIATKNIAKEDEIFVTYGAEYWMQHDGFENDGTPTSQVSSGRGFG